MRVDLHQILYFTFLTETMPEYAKIVLSFVVVAVFVMMASSWSSNLGAEARYLPTRSDPLAVVGPPRGEDPRFDRVYAIVREVKRYY